MIEANSESKFAELMSYLVAANIHHNDFELTFRQKINDWIPVELLNVWRGDQFINSRVIALSGSNNTIEIPEFKSPINLFDKPNSILGALLKSKLDVNDKGAVIAINSEGQLVLLIAFTVSTTCNLLDLNSQLTAIANILSKTIDIEKVKERTKKLAPIVDVGTNSLILYHDIGHELFAATAVLGEFEYWVKKHFGKKNPYSIDDQFEALKSHLENTRKLMRIVKTSQRSMMGLPRLRWTKWPEDFDDFFDSLSQIASSRKVELNLKNNSKFLFECDPLFMERIIYNLVDNAITSLARIPRRRKASVVFNRNNKATTLIVEDNGPGVEPSELSKIRDLHYSTKSNGTGLGLYIVGDYAEKLGGDMIISSNWGRYFRVTIDFPFNTRG